MLFSAQLPPCSMNLAAYPSRLYVARAVIAARQVEVGNGMSERSKFEMWAKDFTRFDMDADQNRRDRLP